MTKTNWRQLISQELALQDETWADVIHKTLTDAEMDVFFDGGYGVAEGIPFTLWTNLRVYLPVQYDGAEWVDSVPRNPCDVKTGHLGGG